MNQKRKNVLAFLYGLGSVTQIRVVGALAITELACLVCFPFVIGRMWPSMRKTRVKTMLWLLGLWFLSAGVTDLLLRHTSLYDTSRGCVAILFMAVMLVCAYALLVDDLQRIRWIALGTLCSAVIAIFAFQPQVLFGLAAKQGQTLNEVVAFKTYYVTVWGSTVRALAATLYIRVPLMVVFAQLTVSVLFLAEGSRGAFLFAALSAIGAYCARYAFGALLFIQRYIVMTVSAGLLLVFVSQKTYKHAALSGWMGETERTKYVQQSQTKIGLLSGRSEFIGALTAIKDSPILGHGSWAVDYRMYRRRILEWLEDDEGLAQYDRSIYSGWGLGYIPAHSHIWQAWVWHGFAGGLFWICVLFWLIKYLRTGIHLIRPLIAYNMMVTLSSFWALLFSPFSNRSGWGIFLATLALTLAEVDRRRSLKQLGVKVDMNEPWDGKQTEWGSSFQ